MTNLKLRVVQAAIKLEDGRIFTLPRPMRHNNVRNYIMKHYPMVERPMGIDTGGFILSDGTYANRKRSLYKAIISKQIPKIDFLINPQPWGLTSEDLYDINGYCIWSEVCDDLSIRPKIYSPHELMSDVHNKRISLSWLTRRCKNFLLQIERMDNYNSGHFKMSPLYQIYLTQVLHMRSVLILFGIDPDNINQDWYMESEHVTDGMKVREELEAYL